VGGGAGGDRSPGRPHRADRVRELREPRRARGAGVGADEQVRRGLPRQALLRRLRVRRHRRGARDRAREEALRRRVRERPAALGFAGEPGGLRGSDEAGRRHARDVARARRPSYARLGGQLLRQDLPGLLLRARRARGDRLRPGRAPGEGPQAEADRGRRLGLFAHDRLEALPSHRRRCRRAPHGGHRAPGGAGRGRPLSEPGRYRRFRHHHDPQDAARSSPSFRAAR
jgi:hypothetical protein